MDDYGLSTYGDRIADVYDERPEVARQETDVAVERLAALAAGGPVLELGIGTGRLALPLAARGLDVHGVDASAAMVAKLRAKDGGAAIPIALGDFADVPVDGAFSLVFVAFNTFFALLTQEDQLRCFRNVAARLAPGGRFLIEAFVPDLGRFDRGQRTAVTAIDAGEVSLDASLHDPVAQRIRTEAIVISEAGIRTYPVRIRYAWPSELDLMARLAGLVLEHRWGGWGQEPFTAASVRHVSVYRTGP